MPAVQSIVDEIFDLKQQRRAVILAHHYQESEIQELADAIGDSLELARKAQEFDGDVIAFCGVLFMAQMPGVPQSEVFWNGSELVLATIQAVAMVFWSRSRR